MKEERNEGEKIKKKLVAEEKIATDYPLISPSSS